VEPATRRADQALQLLFLLRRFALSGAHERYLDQRYQDQQRSRARTEACTYGNNARDAGRYGSDSSPPCRFTLSGECRPPGWVAARPPPFPRRRFASSGAHRVLSTRLGRCSTSTVPVTTLCFEWSTQSALPAGSLSTTAVPLQHCAATAQAASTGTQ
jgi:hypothetical protein